MKKQSTFKNFTNLYELSKTLRFELRPVKNTKKMLAENHIFDIDKNIKSKYEATKPFFDRLHREFIKNSLENVSLENLDKYIAVYKKFTNDRKNKKILGKLESQEKLLRKQTKLFFDDEANNWIKKYPGINFKKKGVSILFEESVFNLLKEKYGEEKNAFLKNSTDKFILNKKGKKISIFDNWKGFIGYFIKFFETRKNLYKDDGTSTAVATRIIDQNLRRFCDNLKDFEKTKSKINFSEIEQDFGKKITEIFSLSFYNTCLLQDGIDFYNKVIGGETLKNGKKIKGVNELINKYRQDHRGEKLPFLKTLDKQILSENDRKFLDEIENDIALKNILQDFVNSAENKISLFDRLVDELVKNTANFELEKIYITKEAFNTISYKWTNQAHEFEKILYEKMKKDRPTGLEYKRKEDTYKFPDFISLFYIADALDTVDKTFEFWKSYYYKSKKNKDGILTLGENVWRQFLQIYKNELNKIHNKFIVATNKNSKSSEENIGIDHSLEVVKKLLKNFELTDNSKISIKYFADNILRYYQLAKYFSIEKKREWNFAKLEIGVFYTNPDFGYEKFYKNTYEEIIQIYNKLRNYLTKKPFNEEKWKLNFENSTLAGGWDKNKEISNSAIILRKNKRYFLGLMKKGSNYLFLNKNQKEYTEDIASGKYEKMVYKLFPGPNKMMPKVCFSKKGLEFFKPSKEILDIYKNNKFKQGDTFSLLAMHKLIDFYKRALKEYKGWQMYNFSKLKNTKEYNTNIGEFYNDVAYAGYKIAWQNISEKYIQRKNQGGELYLFKIHNKDWNLKNGKPKIGTKNLHTLYFESLFSDENASNDFLMKLNGEAELFFRPKTKKEKLGYRKDKNGKYLKNKQGDKVVKNKRYSENKIFLHLSISLNRSKGKVFGFNKTMDEFLIDNSNINVIGVDRGEKHLAYYSVINQEGRILESNSLNKIDGVDYYAKLLGRAKERKGQRQDWQTVTDIKNLKKGYISRVVRKLADLAINYNAIIVLEDLNMRFKQVRGGIEKSIYQQLEKALIEKISFLVNKKEKDIQNAGHLLRAYQLAEPFENFKDMGKQTGIVFYTQASYTSKIDPLTGWRPNLYLKKGNAAMNKEQIMAFDKIEFINNRFEFTYDLKKINSQKDYPQKTKWKLCSSVERWYWDRKTNSNKGGYIHYKDLTNEFKKIFTDFGIDIASDILEQIKQINTENKKNARLFSGFIFLWSLLCQIRNTNGNLDDKIKEMERNGDTDQIIEKEKFDADFILSPVEPFFDSRKIKEASKNFPQNGDDNGAYNIARKGIIILKDKLSAWGKENKRLKKENKKEKYYPDLYISHTDWDNFAQRKK
jgi:hypothetical protein